MPQRHEIQFGNSFIDEIEDDDGAVDLTAATVVFQRREDCGDITEAAATVVDADAGQVSIAGVPVGEYGVRWKYTIGAVVAYYPAKGWHALVVRAVDACNTFGLFLDEVKERVFPEDEAENLIANHRAYAVDGLIDLQQKIRSLRQSHKDKIPQVDTYLECNATVYDAPRGFIKRVSVEKDSTCCGPVDCTPIAYEVMRCILKDNETCGDIAEPYTMYEVGDDYISYPDYGCLYYADSTGGTDRSNRPCNRVVAIHEGLLYVYPHLQSDELLVIEWKGIKRSWKDTDEVAFDREIADALEHYVEAKVARREDCDAQKMQVAIAMYDALVAKLIWQERNENDIEEPSVPCFSNCDPYSGRAILPGVTK